MQNAVCTANQKKKDRKLSVESALAPLYSFQYHR